MPEQHDLKLRTARTLKWNTIDRVSSQVLYAITGIILANILSEEDFGLVGAVMVFHAFATLFVDSGFSYALIQRKSPTQTDYSTVLWFNIVTATMLYAILWFCAPLIAKCFQDDPRLIPLSRVMFLSFIINATSIVQTNRLMKQMTVKMIAISNCIALIVSSTIGIYMAIHDYGAWAIVWQTISLAVIKSSILWLTSRWMPSLVFSWQSLRSIFNVGVGIMASSFLNILFQNIYSFIIGNRVGLKSLGYYTQANKWSLMGVASLSQILTASFLPVLSQFQDDETRFNRAVGKMHRMTTYLILPIIFLVIIMAEAIFHLFFGAKWDAAIILFQILLARGIFTIYTSLYNNYVIALGRSKTVVKMEIIKDGTALIAIALTLPYIALTTPADPTYGLRIMLWGQLIASFVTWIASLIITSRLTHRGFALFLKDIAPYLVITTISIIPAFALTNYISSNILLIISQTSISTIIYIGINYFLKSTIQKEAFTYILGRFRK